MSLTRLNAREYEYPEEKCANNSKMCNIYSNTLSLAPFHLALDQAGVSDLLMLSSREPEPGQDGASLITIHWQLQESQHLLTPSTRSAFIILVTLHLSDVTWYETLSLCLMADV